MSSLEDEIAKEVSGFGDSRPEVGKVYHVFDDGKCTWVRHRLEKCVEVIPYYEFTRHKMYPVWLSCLAECSWLNLYSQTTDCIVVCKVLDDALKDKLMYYTRTNDGGWFGFGTMLDDGRLDFDRSRWKFLIDCVRRGKTGYTADVIKEMEEADKY